MGGGTPMKAVMGGGTLCMREAALVRFSVGFVPVAVPPTATVDGMEGITAVELTLVLL